MHENVTLSYIFKYLYYDSDHAWYSRFSLIEFKSDEKHCSTIEEAHDWQLNAVCHADPTPGTQITCFAAQCTQLSWIQKIAAYLAWLSPGHCGPAGISKQWS